MSESTQNHRKQAQGQKATCAVLTISDTRTKLTDKGGKCIVALLKQAGHPVTHHAIVRDQADLIAKQLEHWLGAPNAFDLIVTTGGTGIASRDTTIEVVKRYIDKPLEGFGELFRMLSWQQVQAAAMMSRAVAGLAGETLIFALPGSTAAVELAMSKLIIPELPHLIWERKR